MDTKKLKKLAKGYKEAEIYFHIDLDGVMSALVMKAYLDSIGVKITSANPIQYGDREYSLPRPQLDKLQVMVDFNSSKSYIQVHTDHHDKQSGFDDNTITYFEKTKSNASGLNKVLFNGKLLTEFDEFAVDTIDSADYARWGITPEEVINPVNFQDNIDSTDKLEYLRFGFVVNKLILSFKNNLDFMRTIVLNSDPNLKSVYQNIILYSTENQLLSIEDIATNGKLYATGQRDSEHSFMKGNNVMIYGLAAYAGKPGSYDRYTLFKNYPNAHYAIVCWPMGLIQVSKNPFKKEYNPHILSEIVWDVLNNFKKDLSVPVSLGYMKIINELNLDSKTGAGKDSIGFTFDEIYTRYKPIIDFKIYTKISNENLNDVTIDSYKLRLQQLMLNHWDDLTEDEQIELSQIKIPLWDIIKSTSGGHKDITNISNLNLLGKDYVEKLKEIWIAIGEAMENKTLIGYDNPVKDNLDVPSMNISKPVSTNFNADDEFIMKKEPFNNIKIKLLNSFINKYNGISWNIEFGNEKTTIWNGTLQSWLDNKTMVDSIWRSEEPLIEQVDKNEESSQFEQRLEYGKEAEKIVLEDLKRNKIQATPSSENENWDSKLDLEYGDIYVKDGDQTIFIDVKRGFIKDNNLTGTVSERSKDNFKGDYYLFTNGINLDKAKLLKARSVKSYMNKVNKLIELSSGDFGWQFNLDKMKTAIDYSTWIKSIAKK